MNIKMLPQKNHCVRKSYFSIDTPNGPSKDFGKHAYHLISSKTFTLIHYLGNEKVAIPFSHRNTKGYPSASFVRTCPSTLKIMKSQCIHNTANEKEISSVDCLQEFVLTPKPRDMKQFVTFMYTHLHSTKTSKDDIYNLHEIAYDIAGFVW